MRIHSISQTQLRCSSSILTSEVVRDSSIIVSSVVKCLKKGRMYCYQLKFLNIAYSHIVSLKMSAKIKWLKQERKWNGWTMLGQGTEPWICVQARLYTHKMYIWNHIKQTLTANVFLVSKVVSLLGDLDISSKTLSK